MMTGRGGAALLVLESAFIHATAGVRCWRVALSEARLAWRLAVGAGAIESHPTFYRS